VLDATGNATKDKAMLPKEICNTTSIKVGRFYIIPCSTTFDRLQLTEHTSSYSCHILLVLFAK